MTYLIFFVFTLEKPPFYRVDSTLSFHARLRSLSLYAAFRIKTLTSKLKDQHEEKFISSSRTQLRFF